MRCNALAGCPCPIDGGYAVARMDGRVSDAYDWRDDARKGYDLAIAMLRWRLAIVRTYGQEVVDGHKGERLGARIAAHEKRRAALAAQPEAEPSASEGADKGEGSRNQKSKPCWIPVGLEVRPGRGAAGNLIRSERAPRWSARRGRQITRARSTAESARRVSKTSTMIEFVACGDSRLPRRRTVRLKDARLVATAERDDGTAHEGNWYSEIELRATVSIRAAFTDGYAIRSQAFGMQGRKAKRERGYAALNPLVPAPRSASGISAMWSVDGPTISRDFTSPITGTRSPLWISRSGSLRCSSWAARYSPTVALRLPDIAAGAAQVIGIGLRL